MRKWITLLMTCLVGFGSYAGANTGQVIFDAGYRHDSINWKSKFPANDPVFSTNSKFKDLDIFQIGLHGRSTLGCNFYVRGDAYWGWILDGRYDRRVELFGYGSDYGSPRRELSEKFRNTLDDEYVFGVGAAIGYPFYFCDCTLLLAPVVGYAFDEQNVRVDNRGPEVGHDSCGYLGIENEHNCCRHDFISRWYGPFIGVDFDYRPCGSCVNLWGELEYHWATFSGKQTNSVRYEDFEPFKRHIHNITALIFTVGLDYEFSSGCCEGWTAGLSLKFQDWDGSRTHRFHGNVNNSSSSGCCEARGRDAASWRSYAINLTLGREF